jgi:hypothetical protein
MSSHVGRGMEAATFDLQVHPGMHTHGKAVASTSVKWSTNIDRHECNPSH